MTPEKQTILNRTEEICSVGSVCVHALASYINQQFFNGNETQVSNPNNQSYLYEYKGCKSVEGCLQLCEMSKEMHKGYIFCSKYCCFGDNCNENNTANNGTYSFRMHCLSSKRYLSEHHCRMIIRYRPMI